MTLDHLSQPGEGGTVVSLLHPSVYLLLSSTLLYYSLTLSSFLLLSYASLRLPLALAFCTYFHVLLDIFVSSSVFCHAYSFLPSVFMMVLSNRYC